MRRIVSIWSNARTKYAKTSIVDELNRPLINLITPAIYTHKLKTKLYDDTIFETTIII
jgi:hypothetical protein